jgi:transcriptional regulator with XRE-family HTH domain
MRAKRREQGISQEELADRCGLHRTYIGAVERAERNVSLDNIDRISTALGSAVPEMLQDC